MPVSPHNQHLERHASMLSRTFGEEKMQPFLESAGLVRIGDAVRTANGAEIDQGHCNRYLQGVEKCFGEAAARFARANFSLAGCLTIG